MKTINDVEVIINNKRYTLSGYESGDYLQKIASYINLKHDEFKNMESYAKLDLDVRNILMQINIADDYFKVVNQLKEMNDDSNIKGNELFELKHELIATKTTLEDLQKKYEKLNKEYNEAQKSIIKLQTELDERKKQD